MRKQSKNNKDKSARLEEDALEVRVSDDCNTYDLGDGVLVLLTETNCLLYCDFVERVHAELDILVDTLTV